MLLQGTSMELRSELKTYIKYNKLVPMEESVGILKSSTDIMNKIAETISS
jgi:uncharacterized protein (DUF488 family)